MVIKKTLVLYKSSAYERLIREKSLIPAKFKKAHQAHYATLRYVERYLSKQGIPYRKARRGQKLDYSSFDLIVTVGGDGTFLEAAKNSIKQVILGVNSAPQWSVGRFCAATRENFAVIFDRLIKEKMPVRQLHRMQLTLRKSGQTVISLNDILVCHHNPAAMSHYLIQVGKKKEEHRSSGIWIATAAGSSGAIQSAGGEVQHVSDNRLQYRTRELYIDCGIQHSLKSGFIEPREKIRLFSLMPEGVIYIDGAHDKIHFPFGEEGVVTCSTLALNVVGL